MLTDLGCRDPGGLPPAGLDEGPLVLATSGDYPPFSHWPPADATPTGFSIELAEAWARDADRAIVWRRFRWRELLADLEANRFEAAFSGVTVRPDRSVAGRFGLPLTTSGAVVLVESAGPLRTLEQLDTSTIVLAVNAGGHLERVARSRFPSARIEPVETNDRVLARLGLGGVSGVLTDTVEAPLWQAQRPGLRAIGPLTHDRKAPLFRIDRTDIRADFDRWLLASEASGRLAALRARHGLPDEATASPAHALAAALDERLSLMIPVAAAKLDLGAPIEDAEREARVLAAANRAIRREARLRSVPAPDAVAIEAFYRAQIEAAKWVQRGHRERSEARPDGRRARTTEERAQARRVLEERLRPALIALGDRIALLLVACTTAPSTPMPEDLIPRALGRHGLPERHLVALDRTLRALLRDAAAAERVHPRRSAETDTAASE